MGKIGTSPLPAKQRMDTLSTMVATSQHPEELQEEVGRQTNPKHRSPISDKIFWDGSRGTFDAYRGRIEGHLLQVNLGYLIQPDFLKEYLVAGDEYLRSNEFYHMYYISAPQALYDKQYMYGALKSTL